MVDQEAVVGRANQVRDFTHEGHVVAPKAGPQPLMGVASDCCGLTEQRPSKVFKKSDNFEAVGVDIIGTVWLVFKGVCCASWKGRRAECRVRGQERNVQVQIRRKTIRQKLRQSRSRWLPSSCDSLGNCLCRAPA